MEVKKTKGNLIALAYVSAGFIAKAILEAAYFKDRVGAKNTLFLWLVSLGSIGFALCISLFIDHFG